MSRFAATPKPELPIRDEFGAALRSLYPAGGVWVPLPLPQPAALPLGAPPLSGGINLGKFFDRATTISKDASPLERQLIGAIPGVLGVVGNIVAPGIGTAAGGVAGKLIHESSGYTPPAPADTPTTPTYQPRAADDLGVPLLAALLLAAVWILTEP